MAGCWPAARTDGVPSVPVFHNCHECLWNDQCGDLATPKYLASQSDLTIQLRARRHFVIEESWGETLEGNADRPIAGLGESRAGSRKRWLLIAVAILIIASLGPLAYLGLKVAPPSLPVHRIGVRLVNGVGEFYDKATDAKFVPRGNNYIRLAAQSPPCGPDYYHSTFDPGLYDPSRVEQALARMQADGYNVVRVFINTCRVADAAGGLSSSYLNNVVEFLRRARASDVFVLFAIDGVPAWGGYSTLLYSVCCAVFDGNNLHYLTRGGIDANRNFWHDFVSGLIGLGAPMESVFAYELRNEAFFDGNLAPLNFSSGRVTTANSRTYDMAQPEDKQRMMDENSVYWIDRVRESILEVDSQSLVTIGFFVPQGPLPLRVGDTRLVRSQSAIANPEDGGSSADFIDLHTYPGEFDSNLSHLVENFGIGNNSRKPIIMGELGAFESFYPSATGAALSLESWQIESCHYRFEGWLLWTWDLENPNIWSALDQNGTIERQLSPKNRPDPCLPGTPLSLSPGSRPSNGSLEIAGKLTDQGGAPIAGARIQFYIQSLDGPGQFAEYTLSDSVPASATGGAVGLWVNQGGPGLPATSEFFLYDVRYLEGNETTNRVPNGNLSLGLQGWQLYGNGTARIEPSDLGPGWMLHVNVTSNETEMVYPPNFPVTPGAAYTVILAARVIPAQFEGSENFDAMFFSNDSGSVGFRKIPVEPPIVPTGSTTTDGTGAFQVGLIGLPANSILLIARYSGDDIHLPADTEISVPAPIVVASVVTQFPDRL